MHEFPITQQIIKIAEETAVKNNAKKVLKISLVVGETSGIVEESIRMYFDIVSKGTIVEGAELEVTHVEHKMFCPKCKKYFKREKYYFDCPECGGPGDPTEVGKEFYIKDIEIDS
jgi:hydrogenase nickel incorporation protein HypA/HybF